MKFKSKFLKQYLSLAVALTLCPLNCICAVEPHNKKWMSDKEFSNLSEDGKERRNQAQAGLVENRIYRNVAAMDKLKKEIAELKEKLIELKSKSGDKNEISAIFAKISAKESEFDRAKEIVLVSSNVVAIDAVGNGLKKSAAFFLPITAISLILRYAGDILEHIKNFGSILSTETKRAWYNLTQKKLDPHNYSEVMSRIEKRLREELIGQDEAIDKILKIMTGYFESVLEAEALGKKFEGGLVLYLTGEPGTGKSTTMKIISEEMNLGTCMVRMSDAVEDKGNGASTVAARLIKPTVKDNGRIKVNEETALSAQIASGAPTLYCFDEIDKMRNLDSILQKTKLRNESGKIVGGSVDEMIRNFGDTGQINGTNISGSILIATSNESASQLKELENSLYSRYKECNIQFKSFDKDDYKKIMEIKLNNIKSFYMKKYGIDVCWDAQALEYYAEKFVAESIGARAVDTLNTYSRCALKEYVSKKHDSKKALIKYNADTKQLYISEAE